MFIGVKLILTFLHETWYDIPKIPTLLSLAVIGAILVVSTIASLIKSKKDPSATAHAGRVTAATNKSAEQKESGNKLNNSVVEPGGPAKWGSTEGDYFFVPV